MQSIFPLELKRIALILQSFLAFSGGRLVRSSLGFCDSVCVLSVHALFSRALLALSLPFAASLRAALVALEASGRVEERQLPKNKRRGQRKGFLFPTGNPAYCAGDGGAIRRIPIHLKHPVFLSSRILVSA